MQVSLSIIRDTESDSIEEVLEVELGGVNLQNRIWELLADPDVSQICIQEG